MFCLFLRRSVLELLGVCSPPQGMFEDDSINPKPGESGGNTKPTAPRSCYNDGKLCAKTIFSDYRRQHALEIKVARFFNTYGPRTHPNDGRVVSSFIVQALTNRPITIFGEGQQTRSFCYVDDLVEGMVRFMDTAPDVCGPMN